MRVTIHRGMIEVDPASDLRTVVFELARGRRPEQGHWWFTESSGGDDVPYATTSYLETVKLAEYYVNATALNLRLGEKYGDTSSWVSFRSLSSDEPQEEVLGLFQIRKRNGVWRAEFIKVNPGERPRLLSQFTVPVPDYDPMYVVQRESVPEPEPAERFERDVL